MKTEKVTKSYKDDSIICLTDLFNDTLSSEMLHHFRNNRKTEDNYSELAQRERVVVCFKALSLHIPEGTEEDHRNLNQDSRISGGSSP